MLEMKARNLYQLAIKADAFSVMHLRGLPKTKEADRSQSAVH